MKKRIVSWMMVLIMAVTMMFGGSAAAFAGTDDGLEANAKAVGGKDVGGLKWSFSPSSDGSGVVPGKYITSPAMWKDYLYVAAGTTLYKLDKHTGNIAGTAALSKGCAFWGIAPTVDEEGGRIFVAQDGATVAIVNAETMQVIKEVTYASEETNHQGISPVIYDKDTHSVYTGSWTGKSGVGGTYARIDLDRLNEEDQGVSILAQDANRGFYWAGACVKDNKVIFGSEAYNGTSKLYAYDLDTGEYKSYDLKASVRSTVVSHGSDYYVATYDGKLYKFRLGENGTPNIQGSPVSLPGGGSICTPVVYKNQLYVGGNTGIAVIDPDAMSTVKTLSTPGKVPSMTIKDENNIYCTYYKEPGGIYNAAAGTDYFIPDKNMQQYGISSIIADGDMLYYKNDSGNLMAVKPAYSIEGAQIAWKNQKLVYNGKEQSLQGITVTLNGKTLVSGTDYRITYENNVNAGVGKVVVTGIGEYARTITKTFTIEKANIAKASVRLAKSSFVYNGKARKPAVTVTLNGKKLTAKDYDATFAGGRKKVGTYKVTVKGTGNYTGTAAKAAKFKILPQKTAISKVTAGEKSMLVKWKKKTAQIAGYQIQYGLKKNFKGAKTATVRKNKTAFKEVTKLKAKKKYYVRVRTYQKAGGQTYYSAWSKAKSVKIK